MKKELAKKSIKVSAANSVNFARIAFQIVYHFWSYFQMVKQDSKIQLGDSYNAVIPSGNFGNALAAYYAKKMGLPIEKIIIATNDNNVLFDFIKSGVYDISDRELRKTNSPAMDILKSSNVERILFDLFGPERTKQLMENLENERVFYLDDDELEVLQEFFVASYAPQTQVEETINWVYNQNKYIIDPHTANAFIVYDNVEIYDIPTIIYSTAEWTKFATTIANAFELGIVPKSIVETFKKKEKHDSVVELDKIDYELLKFSGHL
jgi:threonine synthase